MEIKTIGQLINHLALKAGVKADDVNLVNILSNADITKIPVHSDIVLALDEGLLNIGAAMDQHPKIRAKYIAETLNPLDTRMDSILEELGLDDDTKKSLKEIKSTYQRFDAVTEKLKELSKSKAAATKDADKQALQSQIDTLQNELRTAKEAVTSAKNEYETKLVEDRKDFRLRNYLATKKTTLDTLPQAVRDNSLLNLLTTYLQDNDAELRFDEKGTLQPFKKDGSKFYGPNHTLIEFDSMFDTILATNKLIQVAPAQQQQQQQNNQHQQQPADIPGDQQQKVDGTNQSVANLNMQAFQAFEQADNA